MTSTKRILFILTIGAALGVITLVIHPVHSQMLNLGWILSLVCFWIGLLILVWRSNFGRILLLLVPMIFAVPFLLPANPIETAELREDYLRRMIEFEDAPYHWGGENRFGIDCSGLPRRSYRDALFSYGLRNGNGRACRLFAEQWRYDTSAKAMAEGYREFTTPVGISGKIKTMEYKNLVPGDLAVTKSGAHVLAYLGAGKVTILNGRSDDNIWFEGPVSVYRWKVLSSE